MRKTLIALGLSLSAFCLVNNVKADTVEPNSVNQVGTSIEQKKIATTPPINANSDIQNNNANIPAYNNTPKIDSHKSVFNNTQKLTVTKNQQVNTQGLDANLSEATPAPIDPKYLGNIDGYHVNNVQEQAKANNGWLITVKAHTSAVVSIKTDKDNNSGKYSSKYFATDSDGYGIVSDYNGCDIVLEAYKDFVSDEKLRLYSDPIHVDPSKWGDQQMSIYESQNSLTLKNVPVTWHVANDSSSAQRYFDKYSDRLSSVDLTASINYKPIQDITKSSYAVTAEDRQAARDAQYGGLSDFDALHFSKSWAGIQGNNASGSSDGQGGAFFTNTGVYTTAIRYIDIKTGNIIGQTRVYLGTKQETSPFPVTTINLPKGYKLVDNDKISDRDAFYASGNGLDHINKIKAAPQFVSGHETVGEDHGNMDSNDMIYTKMKLILASPNTKRDTNDPILIPDTTVYNNGERHFPDPCAVYYAFVTESTQKINYKVVDTDTGTTLSQGQTEANEGDTVNLLNKGVTIPQGYVYADNFNSKIVTDYQVPDKDSTVIINLKHNLIPVDQNDPNCVNTSKRIIVVNSPNGHPDTTDQVIHWTRTAYKDAVTQVIGHFGAWVAKDNGGNFKEYKINPIAGYTPKVTQSGNKIELTYVPIKKLVLKNSVQLHSHVSVL